MSAICLQPDPENGFVQVVGVGGIGTGTIIELAGEQTLGRNESRMGRVLESRDYCKLHIVGHYIAAFMGAKKRRFRVVAVGNVGDDAAGATLLSEMADVGIDISHVNVHPGVRTLSSTTILYPDKASANISASESASCRLSSKQISEAREELAAAGERGIALCLPEVPINMRHEFLRAATDWGSYRVASFTSEDMATVRSLELLSYIDLLALNFEETRALAEVNCPKLVNGNLLEACSRAAVEVNPDIRIISSAGADGVHIFENGEWRSFAAVPAACVSTAGAGDALLAGTIAALSAGLPLANGRHAPRTLCTEIHSAISLGLALAAFSISSAHTIHPEASIESLLHFLKETGIPFSDQFWAKCWRERDQDLSLKTLFAT